MPLEALNVDYGPIERLALIEDLNVLGALVRRAVSWKTYVQDPILGSIIVRHVYETAGPNPPHQGSPLRSTERHGFSARNDGTHSGRGARPRGSAKQTMSSLVLRMPSAPFDTKTHAFSPRTTIIFLPHPSNIELPSRIDP